MTTALVTGGARGIGLEVARQLAKDGWRVLLGVRDLAKGQAAAKVMGAAAAAVQVDVGSQESVESISQRVNEPIDVLVNNAGIYTGAREAIWATNLRGPISLTRALEGRLAQDARIVNVTSGLGALSSRATALRRKLEDPALTIDDLLALPAGGYGESKAALNAFTRLLAAQWPARVVNSACPGWVRTEMGGAGAPRSIEQGAASILFCARLPPGGPTGKVWRDGREIGP